MRWTAAIIAGWGTLLIWSVFQSALPASYWFEVSPRVQIENATVGQTCPAMALDRVIHREFHAKWTVTLMKRKPNGGYSTYATFVGANDYRPENELPDDLNLCWWVSEANIRLTTGEYRANTLWRLYVDGGTREIRRTSNTFSVTSEADNGG